MAAELICMISDIQDIRARAEALFKPADTTAQASHAMQEYRAAALCQQEKTRRLREQRLARQAAMEKRVVAEDADEYRDR